MFKSTQKAFTLLELLVVIGIIGLLLSLISASFISAQRQGRDSRRRQDLTAIQNAMEQYYANNSFAYPSCNCTDATTACCAAINSSTYFSGGSAPVDPLGTSHYVYNSSSTSYTVTATLEKDGSTISVSNLQ